MEEQTPVDSENHIRKATDEAGRRKRQERRGEEISGLKKAHALGGRSERFCGSGRGCHAHSPVDLLSPAHFTFVIPS